MTTIHTDTITIQSANMSKDTDKRFYSRNYNIDKGWGQAPTLEWIINFL